MHKIMGAFFVLLFLASCSKDAEQVFLNNLNGKWDKKAEQKFDFKVTDAQKAKNIIFVVRNNNDYPYSNIRLIVNFHDGQTKKKSTDTLNYILAEPNGRWIGKGFGDTKETLFQYKLDYKFPANGDYSIGIIQAMRNDNLPGIEDIGVKIETAQP
ncbi:gliding motility lipoprotein GldH [Chryseobacterium sp. MDT2-18]|uniref:gliding motility lipoprotein GldH n=1 Tax=Chryseobacterium sp. MDT2-18 TaxID=1259136 RepID=UPI00278013C2|nr:gliding motility lipoprotein GldH [Chryseobacterium sp. MDT2-18]MDQ0476010.1 gliding motility-associated lipoprotein GldH [Chryseobacterium sp. MDT2-18]